MGMWNKNSGAGFSCPFGLGSAPGRQNAKIGFNKTRSEYRDPKKIGDQTMDHHHSGEVV